MNTTLTTWPGHDIVQSALERSTAMRLAEGEYQRVADAVDALRPDDWTRPTDCTAWDVRRLVAHIAGMATFASTPLEMARQIRAAKARQHDGEAFVDAQTAVQVAQREHLGPEELRAELSRVGPRAAKGRRRTPGFVRRLRLPEPVVVNGTRETWSLGYLTDVILTRDPWMHRLDLARATSRAPVLTGPAGGHWSAGTGDEEIVMDAADFCRVVAGRPASDPGPGQPSVLLATQVPLSWTAHDD